MKKRPGPSPAQVRGKRIELGLTQHQCAMIALASLRAWQAWEQKDGSMARRMPAHRWEMFLEKVNQTQAARSRKSVWPGSIGG
jgi:hypothetical protein